MKGWESGWLGLCVVGKGGGNLSTKLIPRSPQLLESMDEQD